VGGNDKESVLKAVVDILRLPEGMDPGFLQQVLMAREELSSTCIGDGIAIPHARNPIIMNVPFSMVALCFLERPVDFGAFDGKPVHCLFTFISSTIRIHLHLLSKLAFFLREEKFKKLILGHASREEILTEMECFETVLKNI
jgi:nitrogen PTS system EIIA component